MKIDLVDNFDHMVSLDGVEMAKGVKKGKQSAKDQVDNIDKGQTAGTSNPSLTPERLKLIKKRIAENFYDQDDVLEQIIEQILNSEEFKKLLAKFRKKQS